MPTKNADADSFDEIRDNHPTDDIAAKTWLDKRLQKATKNGVFSEVVDLTPGLAKEFLRHNRENRQIRPAKLKQYVDDIDNGRWELNGEGLIFAEGGIMNDGQHRCQAVIQTSKTIKTIITFGVTRDSRRTVDNGAARAPGDHLTVEGFQYAVEMASIARFVIAYERNNRKKLAEMNRVTGSEVVERALRDPALADAAVFSKTGVSKSTKSVAPPSVLGFCYYVFSQIDEKTAGDFLRSVVTGANLAASSPAYVVRERLIGLDRPLREHRVELLFYAWNAFREGRTLGRVQIKNELPSLTQKTTGDVELGEREGGTAVQGDLLPDDASQSADRVLEGS